MPMIHSSVMQRFDGAEHYMDGALRLLQYVEVRRPTGRRSGADADARWSSFRGDLETVDRIELIEFAEKDHLPGQWAWIPKAWIGAQLAP